MRKKECKETNNCQVVTDTTGNDLGRGIEKLSRSVRICEILLSHTSRVMLKILQASLQQEP